MDRVLVRYRAHTVTFTWYMAYSVSLNGLFGIDSIERETANYRIVHTRVQVRVGVTTRNHHSHRPESVVNGCQPGQEPTDSQRHGASDHDESLNHGAYYHRADGDSRYVGLACVTEFAERHTP